MKPAGWLIYGRLRESGFTNRILTGTFLHLKSAPCWKFYKPKKKLKIILNFQVTLTGELSHLSSVSESKVWRLIITFQYGQIAMLMLIITL